jgi:hypothetical protein
MPELSWNVLLFTYHGALNAIRSIFDYTRCMIFVFDGLVQPQSCMPYVHMGLTIALYNSILFSVVSLDFLPISQELGMRNFSFLVHSPHIYLPMKMEQSVPKRRHINSIRRVITQKKAYNTTIENAKNIYDV